MGIGDTIADAETMEIINETISEAKLKVKDHIRKFQENKQEPEPGRTMEESFENKVNQVPGSSCFVHLLFSFTCLISSGL